MVYKVLSFVILIIFPVSAQLAQDSIAELEPVKMTIYRSDNAFVSASSVQIIDARVLEKQVPHSLVASLNTVAGVRMEERSPGSYRLSMRGSLLRSPFGVRNIKIYLDEFPLTDAGGNTYLNSLDPAAVKRIELVKGPEGSIYGANTGGVVLINPFQRIDTTRVKASTTLGSYGLIIQQLSFQKRIRNYQVEISQGLQKSDGYRKQSAMSRYFLQNFHTWDYTKGMKLKLFAMYANLRYQTPGGLTAAQMLQDPLIARPPSGPMPGAEMQNAGIYNKNYYAGLAHEAKIGTRLSHVVSVFGNFVNFENPFITNYEVRKEKSIGTRTYVKWTSAQSSEWLWNWDTGLEWQQTHSDINNYGNRLGKRDTVQASDGLRAVQNFYFTRFTTDITARLKAEAGMSVNFYRFDYRSYHPEREEAWQQRKFKEALMPKLAFSYLVSTNATLRASVSRGFSPPTISEVRPSDNLIYTNLQAETGWNYESGLRLRNRKRSIMIDAVVFYFAMNNSIVRKLNSNGVEYFTNAGKTAQPGAEIQNTVRLMKDRRRGILRGLELHNSVTYYRFVFKDYKVDNADYSGNQLTGIPNLVLVTGLTAHLRKFYVYVQHNYTSRISLNYANTTYAESYHLVQVKLNYSSTLQGHKLSLFAGLDNLLNENYSLGNDLNAFGNRYFNPAPARNYYVGVSLGM